jgi:hypothetical protein
MVKKLKKAFLFSVNIKLPENIPLFNNAECIGFYPFFK